MELKCSPEDNLNVQKTLGLSRHIVSRRSKESKSFLPLWVQSLYEKYGMINLYIGVR